MQEGIDLARVAGDTGAKRRQLAVVGLRAAHCVHGPFTIGTDARSRIRIEGNDNHHESRANRRWIRAIEAFRIRFAGCWSCAAATLPPLLTAPKRRSQPSARSERRKPERHVPLLSLPRKQRWDWADPWMRRILLAKSCV